jgi:hypothetical protein
MKSLLGFAALLMVGCGFEGITGSGTLITREIPVSDVHKIDATGAFRVDVSQGETASAVVTADDNIVDLLDVRVQDGTLHLGMKSGSYSQLHLMAKVVLPRLDALTLSGASTAELHGIVRDSGNFDLHLSGASSVEGDVNADRLALDLSGASHAKLTGKADVVQIEASGASHAALDALTGSVAHAHASGASEIALIARKHLDYDISGASHIAYGGSPVIDRAQTSGASDAHELK